MGDNRQWQALDVFGQKKIVSNKTLIRRWWILSNLQVKDPESCNFVHPLEIPLLASSIHRRWQKNYAITMAFILLLLLSIPLLIEKPQLRFDLSLSLVLLLGYGAANYWSVNTELLLKERAQFLLAAYKNFKRSLPNLVILLSICLLFQAGNWDEPEIQRTYSNWATIYSSVLAGEYWRFLSGPFVHGNPFHLFENFIFLVLLLPISIEQQRLNLFTILAGSVLSHVLWTLAGLIGIHDPIALVGVSGGVYALLGLLIIDSALSAERYCARLWVPVTCLTIYTLLINELVRPETSLITHFSGLVVGIAIGLIHRRLRSSSRDLNPSSGYQQK